jgi:SAM-dependent methyltransferase
VGWGERWRAWRAGSPEARFASGIDGHLGDWLAFNRAGAFRTPGGLDIVAPFPPAELMQNTTGLVDPEEFAAHGAHFVEALDAASPRPLRDHRDVLDFGVGVGRVARIFKGTRGCYTGVDVDARHVAWVDAELDHVDAVATVPRMPLPFDDGRFDCTISISVFTHMNETDQLFYLSELARVSRPGATLLLTVHGERALARAAREGSVFRLLEIPREEVAAVHEAFPEPGFRFVRQNGHLTSDDYEYGITFIGRTYIERVWGEHFDVVDVVAGGIHDFQDIVVLTARSD